MRRAVPLAALLWALAAVPAWAQSGWVVTPFLGVKFGGGTSIVDLDVAAGSSKTTFGVSTARLTPGVFGMEAEFGYVPGYFEDPRQHNVVGSYVIDLSGAVLLTVPSGVTRGGLRPYASLGLGMIHADAQDVLDIFRIRRTVPAFSLGGGAIGLLTNNIGVRFDIRNLHSLARDDRTRVIIGKQISYWRFSIGIVRRF
ncbi:MAG: outer membrane beta-barrel protein [Vicinamibacterales bacterium]